MPVWLGGGRGGGVEWFGGGVNEQSSAASFTTGGAAGGLREVAMARVMATAENKATVAESPLRMTISVGSGMKSGVVPSTCVVQARAPIEKIRILGCRTICLQGVESMIVVLTACEQAVNKMTEPEYPYRNDLIWHESIFI